jgi:SHAQKYF class myb-like DNA-binding protein
MQLLWWWQQQQQAQQQQQTAGTHAGAEAPNTLAAAQQQQQAAAAAAQDRQQQQQQQQFRQHRSSRVVWDALLHLRFMEACMALGVDIVTPKALLQALDEAWLSRENVASHLQKYRLALRKMAGLPPTAPLPGGQALLHLQQEAIRQHRERSAEVRNRAICTWRLRMPMIASAPGACACA